MGSPFVRAGVAFPAFIKAQEGLHPQIFFRFRRADAVSIERQHKAFKKETDMEKLVESMQAFVAQYLQEWEYSEPVNVENIKALMHPILLKTYFIIIQQEPSDPIPPEYLATGETGTAEGEQKK